MVTRSQKIRLGIFITVAMVVILLAIGTLSYEKIFEKKDIYYITYRDVSVSGIDIGTPVKYLGIKVGSVRNIVIDPKDINQVIVTVALDEGTPIKEDVRAEIASVGITGLKLVELRGGTPEADFLKPGGYIQPGRSITEEITGRAEVITEKIELVLNNLLTLTAPEMQGKIMGFIDESTETARRVAAIVDDNQESIERVLANVDTLSTELKLAGQYTRSAAHTIDTIVKSDTITATIADVFEITQTLKEANLYELIAELNRTAVSLNNVLEQTERLVQRNSVKLIETIDELHLTTRYLHNTARMIDTNPSVLIRGIRPNNPPDNKLER